MFRVAGQSDEGQASNLLPGGKAQSGREMTAYLKKLLQGFLHLPKTKRHGYQREPAWSKPGSLGQRGSQGCSGRLISQPERDRFGVEIHMHFVEHSLLFSEILRCDKLFRRVL